MLALGDRITMSDAEWHEFRRATWAPWRPRTMAEFDAMCDLAGARHLADDSEEQGFLHALAVEAMKFGADGSPNFPLDRRKMEYLQVHGHWPTHAQLRALEDGNALSRARPQLVP